MREDTLLLVSLALEGELRLTIMHTYSVAGAALGVFICDILSGHPAHSNTAGEAVMSTALVTTLNSEIVSGGAGTLDKHPPMDKTLLSTKDSFTLLKPQDDSEVNTIISILQSKKWRLRGFEGAAHSLTASKRPVRMRKGTRSRASSVSLHRLLKEVASSLPAVPHPISAYTLWPDEG